MPINGINNQQVGFNYQNASFRPNAQCNEFSFSGHEKKRGFSNWEKIFMGLAVLEFPLLLGLEFLRKGK